MRLFLTKNNDGRLLLWNGRPSWNQKAGCYIDTTLNCIEVDADCVSPTARLLANTKAVEVQIV